MADTENNSADGWVHFQAETRKRKRAEQVCVACHAKKIRCDIQARSASGKRCTHCSSQDQSCQVRESRRGKRQTTNDSDGLSRIIEAARSQATPPPPEPMHAPAPQPVRRSSTRGGTWPTEMPANILPQRWSEIDQRESQIASAASHEDRSRTVAQVGATFSTQLPDSHQTLQSPGSNLNEGVGRSHENDVDVGYLQVYNQENQFEAELADIETSLEPQPLEGDPGEQELYRLFADTYWDDCYCWCPVLDQETLNDELDRSPLLANALALAGSNVRPPLVPHPGPVVYYEKARALFYSDRESNTLTELKALCLFYWWAPKATSTIHRHSSWWWTSIIIRHAQQMGVHREPAEHDPRRARLNLSLRRRIWWTVFARERLTALCQSKPCIIDPEDCTITAPSLADFPKDPISQKKGLIFIHWVSLCGILGRMAKTLAKTTHATSITSHQSLHQLLVGWVHALPGELSLRIEDQRTQSFDKDVHQLYLPYLTSIIVLNLRHSNDDLPQVLPPAILAASCTVRILRDILGRGNARFLMPITSWYCGMAFLPLLQAIKVPNLAREAEAGLNILVSTVQQLEKMWGSAKVIGQGFDRLRTQATPRNTGGTADVTLASPAHAPSAMSNGMPIPDTTFHDWTDLFPFVTRKTSKIAEELFDGKAQGAVTRGLTSPDNRFYYECMQSQFHDMLDPIMHDATVDFLDMDFSQVM